MKNTPNRWGSANWNGVLGDVFKLILVWVLASSGVAWVQAAQAPTVVSVSPADGATLVPTTSPLVITFDQPMDTTAFPVQTINFDVKAPGTSPALVGAWSADGKILTITPALQYAYATYTWTLNPAGGLAFLRFKSKTGVELAPVSGTFTTGVGGTDPKMGSSTPANNAMNVATNADVTFRFDQGMKTDTVIGGAAGPVTWVGAGVEPAKFVYSWSADKKTLTCKYSGGFPRNTMVLWALNPAGTLVKLEGTNGKALAAYSGQFTTSNGELLCSLTGLPSGWGTYSIAKRSDFRQVSAADPGPATEPGSHVFTAAVSGATSVSGGSLTLPDGTRTNFLAAGAFEQFYQIEDTEAELDAAFPAGTYTLRFTLGGQAERAIPMAMPAQYPPVPKITNFDAAQTVNPAADFTLQWNGFAGAGPNDFISMYLIDETGVLVFQAPNLCVPRPLPATATSIIIPANTLRTNQTYSAALLYAHAFYFSTNEVPLMSGFGNLIHNTFFTVKTVGGGGVVLPAAASFISSRLLPNGNPEFTLNGTVGRTYAVQRTGQVTSATWPKVGSVTIKGDGTAVFEDTQAGKTLPLYYRIVSE